MTSSEALQRDFDLIVLGTGAAGIHAAVQAAKIHKRVCIIEREPHHIGGTWIHTGTVPSKTLRESLAAIHGLQEHIGKEWVHRLVKEMQTGKLFEHAQQVSAQEQAHLQENLKNNGIQVLRGLGSIQSEFSVCVKTNDESKILSTHFILIATGSRPDHPPQITFDHQRVLDADDIFKLKDIPEKMVIYGAGVVGCEYACIFAAMGVRVTLVHSRLHFLPFCDQEIVRELQSFMEKLDIQFQLGKKITHAQTHGSQVDIRLGEESFKTDLLFWAAGRIPRTEGLGLETVQIETDKHAVIVNDNFQTKVPNIYAAGDVIGPPALAATASQQGRFVACHAFGMTLGNFPKDYPIGIYTIPECSMVGKTEEALIREGREYVVGRSYYSEIARSVIGGKTHGLLKLLIDAKTQSILGVHIVGEDACNLVHIGLAFMTKNGHAQDFVNMVFNYPTLAEAYRIAAFNGLNKIFKDGMIKRPPFERRTNAFSSIK